MGRENKKCKNALNINTTKLVCIADGNSELVMDEMNIEQVNQLRST